MWFCFEYLRARDIKYKIEESIGDDKSLLFNLPRICTARDLHIVVLRLEKRLSGKSVKYLENFRCNNYLVLLKNNVTW